MRKLHWNLRLIIWVANISNECGCCTHGLDWSLLLSLGHLQHIPTQSQFPYLLVLCTCSHSCNIPFSKVKLLEQSPMHAPLTWHILNLIILPLISRLTNLVAQLSIQVVTGLTLLCKTVEASHLHCRASYRVRSSDDGDVATDLELKIPGSSSPSHSDIANKVKDSFQFLIRIWIC